MLYFTKAVALKTGLEEDKNVYKIEPHCTEIYLLLLLNQHSFDFSD
jgi:hypothetical protein